MKLLFILLSVISYSAQSLVTFQGGDIATAEDFNANFQENKDLIITNATSIEKLKANSLSQEDVGQVTALVNGIERKITSHALGYTTVRVDQTNIVIGLNGELAFDASSYYESENCSGQPYIPVHYINIDKSIGEDFINPKLGASTSFHKLNGEPFYDVGSPLVKLHYKSSSYNSNCSALKGSTIAVPAYPNDPDVTGVSFPLIISGVGTRFSIDNEIGAAIPNGQYEVYANGVSIGFTTRTPIYYVDVIQVKLYDYDNATINLFKDGSYTGYVDGYSETLYYESTDCSTQPYVSSLINQSTSWWNADNLTSRVIKNHGVFYILSPEAYKFPNGSKSFLQSYSDSECTELSSTDNIGYQKATLTTAPSVPVFEPPITIEGYSEPTQYDQLPDAD